MAARMKILWSNRLDTLQSENLRIMCPNQSRPHGGMSAQTHTAERVGARFLYLQQLLKQYWWIILLAVESVHSSLLFSAISSVDLDRSHRDSCVLLWFCTQLRSS